MTTILPFDVPAYSGFAKKAGGKYYDVMRYFIAMEAAGCIQPADEEKIKSLLPGFKVIRQDTTQSLYGDYGVAATAPLLYSFSQYIGLKDADWTMEFKRENDPTYNTVNVSKGTPKAVWMPAPCRGRR